MKNLNDGTKFMIGAAILFLTIILLQSCATQEQYMARMEARETAYLKRIAADTLARPIQNYSGGLFLNGWVPRYNNGYDGYWYNGVYYGNNGYGPRPLIRLNYNRYVVPYRKSKKYRKNVNHTRTNRNRSTRRVSTQKRKLNGNRDVNRNSSRSSTNRSNNKRRSVNRPRNKSNKQ